jgi:hypothetical protein
MLYGIIAAAGRISLSDDTVFDTRSDVSSDALSEPSDTVRIKPPAQAPDKPSSMR